MTEKNFTVRKTNEVPTTPTTENTLFLVASQTNQHHVEIYVSDKTGQNVRRVITETDINQLIETAFINHGQFKYVVVDDINARNQLENKTQPVYVKNATGDDTVNHGGAFYLYDDNTATWIKVSEAESNDIRMLWADIQDKPSSTVQAIDDAVKNSHTHLNIDVLNKIGQDENGNPTFNGEHLKVMINDAW